MKWEAIINKTDNGYYVTLNDESEEVPKSFVIEMPEEESDNTKAEQICFRNLFNALRDYFAIFNDKHNNQYLDIKVSNDKEE